MVPWRLLKIIVFLYANRSLFNDIKPLH
ncbi:rCG54743 [Rattus norvegicus]|uniref:RCG54743 n=1 Tax=Rattus norvegicus TaxID=10116 RepID=A6KU14_RAT|nr:rCG54743 [Rattus norvegicus]